MQSNKRFVKLPFNVSTASAKTVIQLMVLGYLEVGENGLTTPENKKSLPTANQDRDR